MFEKIGSKLFMQVRPLLLLLLLLTPCVIALHLSWTSLSELSSLQARFQSAARKERIAREKNESKQIFLARHSNPDAYFFEKNIESIELLSSEKKILEKLQLHPALRDPTQVTDRLERLKQNQLRFSEENIKTFAFGSELDVKQKGSVQMDEIDLQKVLCLLEQVPVGSFTDLPQAPQILIKEFRLQKHQTPLHTEVLEVEMQLLKREFR